MVKGNDIQRYFEVHRPGSFLKYSEQLCDKRGLEHYALPRILVQQIFWGRLKVAFSAPTEPLLYQNSLFSLTEPEQGVSLQYLAAVLNSRFISGAYEHWSNRIFGDKFPKVSKLDLARLPIPVGVREQPRIERLGAKASGLWQAAKNHVADLLDEALIVDPSGTLQRDLTDFWARTSNEVRHLLAKSEASLSDRKMFIANWRDASARIREMYSQLETIEARIDELVRSAYGVEESVYADLASRVPAIAPTDLLLPRGR